MKVNDCMCNNVYCVKPNTTISEVSKIMNEKHIGSIPVCDDKNCLCGIVTDRDVILRCIACDKDAKQTPVSEIMTNNVCICKQDEDITNAQSKMAQYQIRRLPVCDENNKVIGILTMGDLTQNNASSNKAEAWNTIKEICDCNGNKNAE